MSEHVSGARLRITSPDQLSTNQRSMLSTDEAWMRLALAEAEQAGLAGDVPVGAVVVDPDHGVIGSGRNQRELDQDPTAHAEIIALREAARRRGAWRLGGATLIVTLEPCPMCAGALVNARVSRVVYGCTDPKAGALDTLFALGRDPRLNHRFEAVGGIMADECSALLKRFFAARRGR
jgi:tRNA(adenine34) deaminase